MADGLFDPSIVHLLHKLFFSHTALAFATTVKCIDDNSEAFRLLLKKVLPVSPIRVLYTN